MIWLKTTDKHKNCFKLCSKAKILFGKKTTLKKKIIFMFFVFRVLSVTLSSLFFVVAIFQPINRLRPNSWKTTRSINLNSLISQKHIPKAIKVFLNL